MAENASTTGSFRSTGSATTAGSLNRDTSHGTTTIDDAVVAKIAGVAVREVPGVHDLGGGAARAIGAVRSRLGGTDQGQGISVEVGEKQAAVDVTLIAEYPVALERLTSSIRSSVIDAVESLVGLEVTEVNITVSDIAVPNEDDGATEAPRVV